MNELKPCPFCGGGASLLRDLYNANSKRLKRELEALLKEEL